MSPPHPVTTAPFNPALPEDGALIIAEVLRSQMIALDDDIQTRATETALTNAVTALNAEIAQRATQADLDAEVAALDADIQTRATGAQLNVAMDNAINTAIASTLPQTSSNSNGVAIFDQAVPSYYDMYFTQGMVDKMNELINALRR